MVERLVPKPLADRSTVLQPPGDRRLHRHGIVPYSGTGLTRGQPQRPGVFPGAERPSTATGKTDSLLPRRGRHHRRGPQSHRPGV